MTDSTSPRSENFHAVSDGPSGRSCQLSGMMVGLLAGFSVLTAAVLCVSTPAEAKIVCKGPYQVIKGQLIGTPYCRDSYLAQVAREYGFRVSAREMRRSFAKRQEVCRLMSQDIRVREICGTVLPYRRGRGL